MREGEFGRSAEGTKLDTLCYLLCAYSIILFLIFRFYSFNCGSVIFIQNSLYVSSDLA